MRPEFDRCGRGCAGTGAHGSRAIDTALHDCRTGGVVAELPLLVTCGYPVGDAYFEKHCVILDVYSDPTCPWCYIGKRRLDRALDSLSGTSRPQVVWRAFLLNPDLPEDGMERNAYLARKFGSARAVETIYDAVARTGLEEGIAFAFDAISRTPSTLRAHRLILGARSCGRQERVMEELFRAYFVGGQDIGDPETLADIAGKAGVDRQEALFWLTSSAKNDPVLRDHQRAIELGIRGVPCFVFNGRHALSGAHSPEALCRIMFSVRDLGER